MHQEVRKATQPERNLEHEERIAENEKAAIGRLENLGAMFRKRGPVYMRVDPDLVESPLDASEQISEILIRDDYDFHPHYPIGMYFRYELPKDQQIPGKKEGVKIGLAEYPGTDEYVVSIDADFGSMKNWRASAALGENNLRASSRLPLELALQLIEIYVRKFRAHDPENRETVTLKPSGRQADSYRSLHYEVWHDAASGPISAEIQRKYDIGFARQEAARQVQEAKQLAQTREHSVKGRQSSTIARLKRLLRWDKGLS